MLLEDGRLLELAADADVGDLRFGQARQVDGLAEEGLAGIGPRLAGDDVHHRRLAGAVGADDAAQFAGVDFEGEVVQRLEAVEADGDVFEVERDAVRQVEFAGDEVAHLVDAVAAFRAVVESGFDSEVLMLPAPFVP